jgi:ribonuclease HII
MEYSPKLKMAMEEIKATISKYDIAAIVIIHTPGHSEYLQKIDPSYSCASFEQGGLKLVAKASELGKEKRDQLLTDTANMFKLFEINSGRIAMTMHECSSFIDSKVNADHGGIGHSSQEQQNN